MIADDIQDAKREQKKKDDIQKNKKSLASIHKINLPQLKDSLDGGPWVEQVDYISKALTEQEHESPLVKQKVLDLVRDSLKSATGSLKALKKTVEGWNELENVIEKIKEVLGNQFVVMEDLQQRLRAMKVPRTRSSMLSNCNELVVVIEYLVNKDMIQHVDPDTFNMLIEKALNPSDHRAKFELHMSALFKRDDEKDVVYPPNLTELERLKYRMQNHKEMKSSRSSRNITEVSLNKVSILYNYIK